MKVINPNYIGRPILSNKDKLLFGLIKRNVDLYELEYRICKIYGNYWLTRYELPRVISSYFMNKAII